MQKVKRAGSSRTRGSWMDHVNDIKERVGEWAD